MKWKPPLYLGEFMKKLFCGLDLSLSSSGAVIIDEDYNIVKMETLTSKVTGTERLMHLRNKLDLFISEYKDTIKLTAIENYAYGKINSDNGGRVFEIGEWGGITRLYLFENDYQFILSAPTQIKKYISGKGTAKTTKGLVMLDIYKQYGIELRQDDIADAYVLARIAKDFYDDNIKILTTSQQEVIKAMHKSIDEGTIGVFLR